jgi:hypothetical protein
MTQPGMAQPSGTPAGRAITNATGHPEVDAVLESLVDIAAMTPAEQVARYNDAHRALQQTLRTIDTA